jgi:hypothetical protein
MPNYTFSGRYAKNPKFLSERRKMMQEWADYLDSVVGQSKVVHVDFA